jgi:hypothetical protein
MLQRLEAAMTNPAEGRLEPWLNRFNGGKELLSLKARLRSCTIEKRGGLLFSESA